LPMESAMNSADLVARLRKEANEIDTFGFNDGTTDLVRKAADRIEALEAWKAGAMEFARFVADYSNDPHVVSAARRLVEKEDGRHG